MKLARVTFEVQTMAKYANICKQHIQPGTPEEAMKAEEAILDLTIDLRDLKKAVRKAGKA